MLPPHHSGMRLPTLPAAAGMALAGAVVPVVGGLAGMVLIGGSFIFNSDGANDAFIHHGEGILIEQDQNGHGIIFGNLPPEVVAVDGKLLNGKQVILFREFVQNLFAFREKGIEHHSMEGYANEMKTLFHYLLKAWKGDSQGWIKWYRDAIKKIEAELSQWRKQRADHILEFKVNPLNADATHTERSNPFRTPSETEIMYDDQINSLIAEKIHAEIELEKWSRPDIKSQIFEVMLPENPNRFIEQEMNRHLSA